ncbi:MAG: Sel1 repeat protein [Alphaproteobacteria bacterium ADurb.Bin438]|nr:MAG: Sel1 repeat protein [Alphaproteobacteria bacterium ADurb.Bin438]
MTHILKIAILFAFVTFNIANASYVKVSDNSYIQDIYERAKKGDSISVDLLEVASMEKNDKDAQFFLGMIYEKGEGARKNPIKAFENYQKAADQGHLFSILKVGWFYEMGIIENIDYEKAAFWYEKAANQKHLGAILKLGDFYFHGRDKVKIDLKKAKHFYNLAVERGDVDAKNYINEIENGEVVNKNGEVSGKNEQNKTNVATSPPPSSLNNSINENIDPNVKKLIENLIIFEAVSLNNNISMKNLIISKKNDIYNVLAPEIFLNGTDSNLSVGDVNFEISGITSPINYENALNIKVILPNTLKNLDKRGNIINTTIIQKSNFNFDIVPKTNYIKNVDFTLDKIRTFGRSTTQQTDFSTDISSISLKDNKKDEKDLSYIFVIKDIVSSSSDNKKTSIADISTEINFTNFDIEKYNKFINNISKDVFFEDALFSFNINNIKFFINSSLISKLENIKIATSSKKLSTDNGTSDITFEINNISAPSLNNNNLSSLDKISFNVNTQNFPYKSFYELVKTQGKSRDVSNGSIMQNAFCVMDKCVDPYDVLEKVSQPIDFNIKDISIITPNYGLIVDGNVKMLKKSQGERSGDVKVKMYGLDKLLDLVQASMAKSMAAPPQNNGNPQINPANFVMPFLMMAEPIRATAIKEVDDKGRNVEIYNIKVPKVGEMLTINGKNPFMPMQ